MTNRGAAKRAPAKRAPAKRVRPNRAADQRRPALPVVLRFPVARTGVVDDAVATERAVARYRKVITAEARRYARGIAVDDLVQEALVRLWELGPARFTETDSSYVISVLLREMRKDVARAGAKGHMI